MAFAVWHLVAKALEHRRLLREDRELKSRLYYAQGSEQGATQVARATHGRNPEAPVSMEIFVTGGRLFEEVFRFVRPQSKMRFMVVAALPASH